MQRIQSVGSEELGVYAAANFLEPAKALRPPQTKDTNPTDPSSTAAPISHASQPLPSKTTPPSGSQANSGLSNKEPNGSRLPVENNALEKHKPPTGTIPTGLVTSNDGPAITGAASNTKIGGHVVQAATSAKGVFVDGQYINLGGGSITLSGTPIVLQSNGDLLLGTSTVHNLLLSLGSASTTVFTVGSQAITLSSNNLIAGGTTLKLNDPAVTVDGTTVSLGYSALQIGAETIPLGLNTKPIPTPALTIAGQPVQVLPDRIVIAGTTLTSNAPAITLAGMPISFAGNSLVVGVSTIPLPSPAPTSVITIAGQKYTIFRIAHGVSIAGKIIQMGQPGIKISGTQIALDSSGLVVNGAPTIPLQDIASASAQSTSIGGFVDTGLNGDPAPSLTNAGLTASNQAQKNATGTDGGLEVFLGRGASVAVPVYFLLTIVVIVLLS